MSDDASTTGNPSQPEFHAQAVLKRADGGSILDTDANLNAAAIDDLAVDPVRRRDAVRRLRLAGFRIEQETPDSVSLAGPAELFRDTFGIDPDAGGLPRRAKRIPSELADIVADVLIPEAPEDYRSRADG